jgi:hypothetical protein
MCCSRLLSALQSLYVDLKQAADHPKTPLQRKYGDFYAACMIRADVVREYAPEGCADQGAR